MNLKEYLTAKNIWHRFLQRQVGTSAKQASVDTGVALTEFGKSLVLLDKKKNSYLAIVPGHKKLSFQKIKRAFDVKKIRLCPHQDAVKYSGYEPGATPPIHHKEKMMVVLDNYFKEKELIYGGGGSKDLSICLKTSDVIKLNNASFADICK